jgi:cytoskeletal protein CcmA (bactofilin family)
LFNRRKRDDSLPAAPGAQLPAGLADPPDAGTLDEFQAGNGTMSGPQDSGLGVPPYRPAPPKEAPAMSRPPFSTASGMPAAPQSAARPGAVSVRSVSRDPAERRTLVVGRGISLQGTVQEAERLVVEGTVEASMIHASELSIAQGGIFKGEVEVEDAEIAGTIDGTLTARSGMVVRSTGRVLGTARCRRLQVEDGGQISGRVEMITDQPKADAPPRLAETTVPAKDV